MYCHCHCLYPYILPEICKGYKQHLANTINDSVKTISDPSSVEETHDVPSIVLLSELR